MIKKRAEASEDAILRVADLMVSAAITAPKADGRDTIEAVVISGEDKDRLRDAMLEVGREDGEEFITRDAGNVDRSICVVIIGCINEPLGLNNCRLCGFKNCNEMKKAGTNCAFNLTDLGIAVGSAVTVASNHNIDNRVMYSAGKGAIKIGVLSGSVKVCYGIPLSVNSKNIYFDRNPGAVLR